MIHGVASATIRDLRTKLPRVKRLVAAEGEVVVTDRGRPAFVLRAHEPPRPRRQRQVDYLGRLRASQPKPVSLTAERALDADRDER
jgi:antitoxin (DNA-binding transcriptional repressor) of toxin-antitoxin stability system